MKTAFLLAAVVLAGCGDNIEGGPGEVIASLSCEGTNINDARLGVTPWTHQPDGATWDFSAPRLRINTPGQPVREALWCAGNGILKIVPFDDLTMRAWPYVIADDALTMSGTYRLTR